MLMRCSHRQIHTCTFTSIPFSLAAHTHTKTPPKNTRDLLKYLHIHTFCAQTHTHTFGTNTKTHTHTHSHTKRDLYSIPHFMFISFLSPRDLRSITHFIFSSFLFPRDLRSI